MLLASGCAQELSLHARVGAAQAIPSPLTVDGITVDRVQLVLREVRLESRATVGDEASLGREVLLEGPTLLDLSGQALTGALTPILRGGHGGLKSFYELDADLRPVSAEEAAAHPELAPLEGASLIISGHQQGAPFVLASALVAVLKAPGVFQLGTNHNNLDANFDPALWFDDGSGATLDPTDPANRDAIATNFVHSLSAFEDDDVDGVPDPIE